MTDPRFERLAKMAADAGVPPAVLDEASRAHADVVWERDAAFGLLRWLAERDPKLLSLLVEISERAENMWLDDVLLPIGTQTDT